MKDFIISIFFNLVLILISFTLFKLIIKGSLRHKIYEKILSSFSKFVIYIFLISIIVTGLAAYYFYKSRYIEYLNIAAPAILSILVGFISSTVPGTGVDDKKF